ncbi:hypothetical protein [Tepidibacter aestuarii]|uniref:hypothetical protein n=1 Tax=Tepidibacter aestuarii TaxID=2925782 RepID=UPI0020BEAF97|nr:hypothetical protein [Tepidibacter aestuarii]CAH2215318.1 conserved membrane protein of unknown function [Tepidibacter aestuarii]
MYKSNEIEVILWSIAIPGFGQILNKKYIKGILLITSEFLINMNSHLNTAIISSFYGEISTSINQINYQWLMFYPCIYMFAIWDAYKDSVKKPQSFSFFSYVLGAYFGTVGVIYSKTFRFMGILIGPIWLPLVFILIGLVMGSIIKKALIFYLNKKGG